MVSRNDISWIAELKPMNLFDRNFITRRNRILEQIASTTNNGTMFAIYRDKISKKYCAHFGIEWVDESPPNLGWYDKLIEWEPLLDEIAARYHLFAKENSTTVE